MYSLVVVIAAEFPLVSIPELQVSAPFFKAHTCDFTFFSALTA